MNPMNPIPFSFAGSRWLVGLIMTSLSAQSPTDGPRPKLPANAQEPAFTAAQEHELGGGPQRLGSRLPSVVTPIHTAVADLGQAYGIWAAGDDYKVSFHDGMTFIPYLGRDYPQNQPLSWRTTSARVGTTNLLEGNLLEGRTESGILPTHHQSDYRYEYRFGGITEAYDVRADGLEQTFVISQQPATGGDLVITGTVTTQLQTQNVAPAHQALQFVDTLGQPILDYGTAIAIDSNGDTVPVSTGFDNGQLTLTVPRSWLAQAVFPIVVDPLLSRVQFAFWGSPSFGTVGEVDIGRDDEAAVDNVMITYSRFASTTDSDVWARLGDDDYSGSSIIYSDITTSWYTHASSCAFVGGADRWVVVFRRFFGFSTTRTSQLRCHVHDSGDTALATNYGSLNPGVGNNDWRPDVGGVEAFQAGSNACVVFQREDNSGSGNHFNSTATTEVRGALLDATTTNGTFGTPFLIYGSSAWDTERPSISQVAFGGANFSWMCAFQSYSNNIAGDDWDVVCKRIDQSGAVAAGLFATDFASLGTDHQVGPQVEGNNGRYLVTFATVDLIHTPFQTTLVSGKQIHAQRFTWPETAAVPTSSKPSVFLRGSNDRRWEVTGLGYDTNDNAHWGIGFRAVVPGLPIAYYARVGYNGAPTEGPTGSVLYSVSGEEPTMVSCCFDNDHNDFMFAYGVDDGTSTLPVFGHTLEYAAPPAITTAGSACGSASISWTGSQQIGSEFNRIVVDNGTAGVGHFLIVSLGTTNMPILHPAVAAGCSLLVEATGPLYLGTMPFQFGSFVRWPLALPEWLGPMTFHFQDWMFDGTVFHNTQRLSVPVIK